MRGVFRPHHVCHARHLDTMFLHRYVSRHVELCRCTLFNTAYAKDRRWLAASALRPPCMPVPYLPHYCGVTYMNLELIGQLVSVALVVGAGPIIVAAVYARGGNL